MEGAERNSASLIYVKKISCPTPDSLQMFTQDTVRGPARIMSAFRFISHVCRHEECYKRGRCISRLGSKSIKNDWAIVEYKFCINSSQDANKW